MNDQSINLTAPDGTELMPVPYMSQDYDDLITSLTAAIEARKVLMAPLIELMHGEVVSAVIDYLEEHADKYQGEPLVATHYNDALGCLKRLRDASKS